MIPRCLQLFSVLLLVGSSAAAQSTQLEPGRTYSFSLHDVDGNDLATADGHVTVMTVVTRQNENEAHAAADRVPDRYIGNPKYRYITVVNFQKKLARPIQGVTRAIIRSRLEAEAKELKPDYDAKKLARDPRHDLFVVADFDGSAVTSLGMSTDSNNVAVFVFDGRGKLINRWNGVPPGDSLAQAIMTAEQ
ncbi:MAG: hypothetical protein H0U43_03105 [Chthoniobacterales bacterium]|nr:hypothetical protein [Chthoniobacterales bacterium]